MLNNFNTISEAISFSREMLKTYGEVINTQSWQGIKKGVKMYEYLNLYWSAQVPRDLKTLKEQTKPDLPWADKHFEERVKGFPTNPGETYKIWPFYKNTDFNDQNFRNVGEKFTHTYMERYWPKFAGEAFDNTSNLREAEEKYGNHLGIRYHYGDLWDVIKLLTKDPYTRQAYLPVWFPEDTGVIHGGRVPCSIGYHFIMRHNKLNIHYTIRACDYLRHFRNDIYLTCRLLQWVLGELTSDNNDNEHSNIWDDVTPGLITMDIISLHVFEQEKNLI